MLNPDTIPAPFGLALGVILCVVLYIQERRDNR